MATKLVKYNGGVATYTRCSSPKLLQKGEFYEVISMEVLDSQTNYKLKGVDGDFNSVWFDDVKFALVKATKAPKLNERFLCYQLVPYENKFSRVTVLTSLVRKIEQLSTKMYKIYTLNTCYIVQVI